jgi:hypothetical protein
MHAEILTLFAGALLEKQIVVLCSNLVCMYISCQLDNLCSHLVLDFGFFAYLMHKQGE